MDRHLDETDSMCNDGSVTTEAAAIGKSLLQYTLNNIVESIRYK